MSEFTTAAAERIRNEIRQEFEGLEQKLEDAINENACLRKILDDLQVGVQLSGESASHDPPLPLTLISTPTLTPTLTPTSR